MSKKNKKAKNSRSSSPMYDSTEEESKKECKTLHVDVNRSFEETLEHDAVNDNREVKESDVELEMMKHVCDSYKLVLDELSGGKKEGKNDSVLMSPVCMLSSKASADTVIVYPTPVKLTPVKIDIGLEVKKENLSQEEVKNSQVELFNVKLVSEVITSTFLQKATSYYNSPAALAIFTFLMQLLCIVSFIGDVAAIFLCAISEHSIYYFTKFAVWIFKPSKHSMFPFVDFRFYLVRKFNATGDYLLQFSKRFWNLTVIDSLYQSRSFLRSLVSDIAKNAPKC